jgi:signal transduction histidine kinase
MPGGDRLLYPGGVAVAGELQLVTGPSWIHDRWVVDGASWPRWIGLASAGLISGLAGVAVAAAFTPWRAVLALVLAVLAFGGDAVDMHIPWYLYTPPTLAAAFLLVGHNNASFALFAVLIILGSVATTQGMIESLIALVAVEAVLFAHALGPNRYYRPGWISWMAANVMVWVASRAFKRQAQLMTELQQAQAALADQAVAHERQRIAREIHDVIAHSLTVTMLHLTGARLAIEHDPAEATAALLEAERLGRQSLADIRRTVGLLAPADGVDATAPPLPGAGDIRGLVAQYRGAGLDVRAKITGDTTSVSLAGGLGLYRIVQEALANVAKHSPSARSLVTLDVGSDAVRLRVRSRPGPGLAALHPTAGDDQAPHGLGIQGMVERASLLGGWLSAGSEGDGWLVEAELPLEGRQARTATAGPDLEDHPDSVAPAEAARP